MYKLNSKIASLTPYEPIKGNFKVRLDANESYLGLDKEITNEIAEEIKKIEFNRYPDTLSKNACEAFADYYGVDKNLVTAGNGSDELISVIVNGFFSRGDKVAITSPDFSMYDFYCYLSELESVVLSKGIDNNISIKEIIKGVKESNAKGLILSNPCNPTSKGFCKEEIILLVKSLPDTLIVLDEAYMDFYGDSVIKNANCFDNLIILKTCSKAFGLAAIRLGFAVANPTITKALRAIKSPYNVNSLTACTAAVVLRHKDYLKSCTSKIIEQKQKLAKLISALPNIEVCESKTNFVFIKTKNAKQIFEFLLKNGIAVRQLGDYIRVNAGSDEEHKIFLNAFKEAL